MKSSHDAVVIGSGPNGLSAAITLAMSGVSTLLVEAQDQVGGGMRSSELTLPGRIHDVCSAVHPLGVTSPFFRAIELERHGLSWIDSPIPVAHVMEDGSAVVLEKSIEATAEQFGVDDRNAYRDTVTPFVEQVAPLFRTILAPLGFPSNPFLLARFGWSAIQSMRGLAARRFRGRRPGALLAGIAAHAMVPLESLASASFGLVLAIAGHAVGWPVARGGSQSIANALASCFRSLGGEIVTDRLISRFEDLPPARAYLFDVSPRQLLAIAGDRLSTNYRRRLEQFRYGPGAFKVDFLLSGPIPWRDVRCRHAVTVHLSGGIDRIAESVRRVHEGAISENPLVLVGQPSIVDPSRAPNNEHTAWAYCHVPHASSIDALSIIEDQIEKLAPGFRDLILAKSTRNATELERYNPNYVGGDINSGLSDLSQLFFRPMLKLDPFATSHPEIFLCSSSTPPGGGVHGMCGYWSATSALRKRFGRPALALLANKSPNAIALIQG